jgi:crossover junction endodeoxyribonuclease RusA
VTDNEKAKEKMTIELRLPWPVSTNKAWKPMGNNRMRLNPKAKLYRLAVKSYVLAAKLQGLPLQGNLEATITLYPPDHRTRDEDNFAGKTLYDALTKAGFWGDDSQVRAKHVYWGNVVKGGAVVIQVKPFVQEVAA